MRTRAFTTGHLLGFTTACCVLGLAVVATAAAGQPAAGDTLTCRCAKVVDGDTLLLEHEGQQLTVDLAGVDAPELDQKWGKEARSLVNSMVRKQDLEVTVVSSTEQGITARVVARATDLSALLAKSGLATAQRSGDADSELADLCDRARDRQNGMWKTDGHPASP